MSDRQTADLVTCPACGKTLDEGFLSYCSGAVWHRRRPTGLQRPFWSAFSSGEPVFGSLLSSPVVSSVSSYRCPECHTVVIPGGPSGPLPSAGVKGAA